MNNIKSHEDLARRLYELGWDSPCDAQWEKIRTLWNEIQSCTERESAMSGIVDDVIHEATIKIVEHRISKMQECLRVVAYPRRGTWEEKDFTYLQDAANYIQQNFYAARLRSLTSPQAIPHRISEMSNPGRCR